MPAHLIFEITETAAMSNMVAARAFVEELSELGCGVALDDFGTGFGSLQLPQAPADQPPEDRHRVRQPHVRERHRPRGRQIDHRCRPQPRQADRRRGVEDAETLAVLREYGVDCAQGFYIGRPAPLVPIDHLTLSRRSAADLTVPRG